MKCPCCAQEMPTPKGITLFSYAHSVATELGVAKLSPTEFRIVDVAHRMPRQIAAMVDAVYSGADAPMNPENCIAVMATVANRKLKSIGLFVGTGENGPGRLWRLSRVAG